MSGWFVWDRTGAIFMDLVCRCLCVPVCRISIYKKSRAIRETGAMRDTEECGECQGVCWLITEIFILYLLIGG